MASSYDISALGTWLNVTAHPYGDKKDEKDEEIELSDFPEDLNPVTVDDGDAGTLELDLNGKSYRRGSPRPIGVSVALVPASDEDAKMNGLCIGEFTERYRRFDIVVHYRNGVTVAFKNGILRSVKKGWSYVGEGKLEVRRYGFQFPPPGFD